VFSEVLEKERMIRSRENLIGAWAFLIGIVLAVAVGIFANNSVSPLISSILALLGLVVGFFVAEKHVQTFLIASVSLVLVSFAGIQGLFLSAAIRGVPIWEIISSVLGSLLILFVPATIVVALKTVFALAKS